MSHVVQVRVPDGRVAVADYTDPIVTVMRRHLKRIADPPKDPAKRLGSAADLADLAEIAAWLDRTAPLAGEQLELAGLRPEA